MKNYQQKSITEDKKDLKINAPLVTEYMTKELITFTPQEPIRKVVQSLLANRISGAPVINEEGKVVGLIDDKDCLNVLIGQAYYNNPSNQNTVSHYMSDVMKSVSVDDNIVDIANIFLHSKYKRLLVIDHNGKLAGQISRRDILRAIKDINASTW